MTVAGRSGAGTSRLAVEAALRAGPDLPGGAVFVDMATVAEIGLLPAALAVALDVAVVPGQDPEAALRRDLEYLPTLIVVDDIDRLSGAVDWILGLIDDCPGSRLLATARAPLRRSGERVVRVGPLSTLDSSTPTANQPASPAVQLFADRASAVQHTFKLDRSNMRQVAELCRRLDGLPMAIELVAARSSTLSPSAQLRLLERGTALDIRQPQGRAASVDATPSGLRDAIALTHELIDDNEQAVLRRMAIFEGPASLEALSAVCAPDADQETVIERLMTLVDVQLVEPDNQGEDPRYRLLPMIREFANERLVAAGELHEVGARHGDYFCSFARSTRALPEHRRVVALAAERNDLHAILGRLVAARDVARAASLADDLGLLWERYGWFPVAQRWVEDLIAIGESDPDVDPEARALPLIWWARLSIQVADVGDRASLIGERQRAGLEYARLSGSTDVLLLALSCIVLSVFITHDLGGAASAATEGLQVAKDSNSQKWLSRFEAWAGMASSQQGNVEVASALGRSALERARRNDDLAAIVAPSLLLASLAPSLADDIQASLPTYEELLGTAREIGDIRAEGWVLTRLSFAAMRRGDLPAALRWATEALELGSRTGLWDAVGFAIVLLAQICGARGDDAAVARLHGSIGRIMPTLEVSLGREHIANYRNMVEDARQRSGPDQFDRLAHASAAQSWDEATLAALDYARRLAPSLAESVETTSAAQVPAVVSPNPAVADSKLTPRELDVLRLLATGARNNEIAQSLGMSPKTVTHHSMRIYAKLGIRGRAEAASWAYRNGLAGATQSA